MGSVDVVVPSFQYGRFLRECVTSVLTQDLADLRVLIIDNASTDNSVEVARQLAHEDPRVEVLARPRNLGPHASFNDGIDWAAADYFLILCADDRLTPGALARAVAAMERLPQVHLCYGAARPQPAAGDDGQWRIWPGEKLVEHFCRTGRNHIPGPTAVVRTRAQKQAGHYRKELPHTDDLEMWMRLACLGNVAETRAAQAVARCHRDNQSASVATIHHWDLAFEAAFESFFAHEGHALADAPRLLETARRTLGERAYWCALSNLCRGEGRLAVDLMKFSWRVCPSPPWVPPLGHLLRRLGHAL